ncbi:MAG TPA: hypothetical protein VKB26_05105 [Candidatus Acidoferrales bacterium]|nr:hypothetical protein [Candidatus Acidoferrales bacterium]
MRHNWTCKLTHVAATAAAIFLAAGIAPLLAHAQSKYANDTYMVVSRADGGGVDMHVDGNGDHCWATTSNDEGVGISMGDSRCTLWDEGADDDASMRAKLSPNKISFRLNGKSYSISDADTIKRARGLFGPLTSIQEQQSVLGEKQRGLGAQQRDLGAQQREVKVPVPDMDADFKKVEADAKRLSAEGGTQSELGDLQSELGDLQSRLGDLQSQAGDAQSKLGDQQSVLGDQQSKLGDQQSELGDKAQEMASGIVTKLRGILSQSIQNGTAKAD